MPVFTDKKGRKWELELDLLTCRRIDKSDFSEVCSEKFSILQMEPKVAQLLITNPNLCFAIIWAIIQPQVKEKYSDQFQGTAEEQELEFVSGINAKAKQEGVTALFEAMGDFFPELKTGLSVANQRLAGLSEKMRRGAEKLEPLLEELEEQEMEKALAEVRRRLIHDEKPGTVSMQSPASPDTIPQAYLNQESLSDNSLSPTT